MNYRNCSRFAVTLAFLALSACSEPTSPAAEERAAAGRFINQALLGSYNLFFMIETRTGLLGVDDSAPVRSFLVLRSEVKDNAGALATVGKVTYEFCWSKGDYAPSAACETGSGSWRRLFTMNVDPIGSRFGFGSCSTPRTIGFRFTYSGRGAIAAGVSAPRDFTWY